VAYSASGSSGNEVSGNVVATQRIDCAVSGSALDCPVYDSPGHIGGASNCDIGNQASTQRKPSQAACDGSSGYAPSQLGSVNLTPIPAVLAQLGIQVDTAFNCPSDNSAHSRREAIRTAPIRIPITKRIVINVAVPVPRLRKL
jgi:hypothetical protein